MNFSYIVFLVGLSFLHLGGVMAENQWFTLHDQEMNVRIDFPHKPLEMSIELPFANTPPKSLLKLYSLPTHEGLFVLSIYEDPTLSSVSLNEKYIRSFFDNILVPHFFYNPQTFHDHQFFHVTPKDEISSKISIEFQDHGVIKKLEGETILKGQTLYLYFYLASNDQFDQKAFERYLHSVHLSL